MAYEQKDMSGALFKNDKGGNEKRPDYRGVCKIGGTVYKISAWIKDKADGETFMSLAFDVKASAPAPSGATEGASAEPLPF